MDRNQIGQERSHTHYKMSKWRGGLIKFSYVSLWFGIGWSFYEHLAVAVMVSLLGFRFSLRAQSNYESKRKEVVAAQFEQILYSITASLQSGKSVENAFKSAIFDLKLMYADGSSQLLREVERLSGQLENGSSIESAVDELQQRLQITEITIWASLFSTCKRTGGNLVSVMRFASNMLIEKMNLERELTVLLAGKRFEVRMMTYVPFVMIALLRLSSPEYMAPLYEGTGRFVMTGCLLIMLLGKWLAENIMRWE
jgi:tight adherence protein B